MTLAKTLALAAAGLLLMGNSDAEKLLKRAPGAEADSLFPVQQVAACIAKAGIIGTPSIVQEADRTLVLMFYSHTPVMIFVITPKGEGSHVALHRIIPMIYGERKMTICARTGSAE